jgi:nucleoid-associated protein YgaU
MGTEGHDVVHAEVQADGHFVLYSSDKPVWHTDTQVAKDVKLVLQDDRNFVLYAADGPAWSSKTDTSEPPPPAEAESRVPEAAPAAEEPAPAPEPEAAPAPPPPPPPAPRTYTVAYTLWAISERFYGDGSKYQVIADASGVSDSDWIHPGQVLTIP